MLALDLCLPTKNILAEQGLKPENPHPQLPTAIFDISLKIQTQAVGNLKSYWNGDHPWGTKLHLFQENPQHHVLRIQDVLLSGFPRHRFPNDTYLFP